MKFLLACLAAEPVAECKKQRSLDLGVEKKEEVIARWVEMGNVCTPCFKAGKKAKKVSSPRRSARVVRDYNPDELVEVSCANRKCKYAEMLVPEYKDKDGVVVRPERIVKKAALVEVARKNASGALCAGCIADATKEVTE